MTHDARPADRLADWLGGLGLLDSLEDAGLPKLIRGADGRAHWQVRATGEPLTDAEVEALEAQLRQQGEAPEHAVPLALVLLARRARVRKELLGTLTHDYASLAEVRGISVNAARFQVAKSSSAHELLVVVSGADTLVPAFQLDAAGEVREELRPVLRALLGAGMDPWNAWAWLTQPAGLLGGDVPERLASDPEEAPLVVHAAKRLADRVKADPNAPVKPVVVPTATAVPTRNAGSGDGCGCGGHH